VAEPFARKLLIRAGRLKTYWTKPQGAAAPQLWALQHGAGLRGNENIAASDPDGRIERMWCRVEGANDVQKGYKIALEARGEAGLARTIPFA
jgi:hypothetical protein